MKLFDLRTSIIILLLSSLGSAFGQLGSISLESKVDRAKITIGDRITYSIIITKDENVTVKMPEFGANLGAFEILDYDTPEPQKVNDKIVEAYKYIISTFDIGEYEIPPVAIRFTSEQDTVWQELSTEKIKIEVESLKPSEEGDIKDIKPPLELKRDIKNLVRLIIAVLALLLIGLLIYYFIKRRRAGKSLLPMRTKPPRPAHEIALQELDKLVASDLLEKLKYKQFYIRISEIIRRYIEGRFSIIAIEMTTKQLIQNMEIENIEPEIVNMITEFLHGCDFVKFAKYQPTVEENEVIVQQAYDIVTKTKVEIIEDLDKEKTISDSVEVKEKQKAEQTESMLENETRVELVEKEVE